MTLTPPAPSLVPAFVGFTQNGEAQGSAIGFFDLLCLSGMLISVLADDSFTASTGGGQSANYLYVEDTIGTAASVNMSATSADTSALKSDMSHDGHSAKAEAGQFQFSFDQADSSDPDALLHALGGFVALLMLKNTVHQCAY